MTSKFTIDDIVTKRLTVGGKRIQSLNLGTLVVIDPSYNVGIGTSAPKLRLDISGSNGIRIPVGTDVQRPTTGGNGPTDLSGVLRYNTELNQYEAWALDGWQAFGGSNLQLYNQYANPKIQLTRAVSAYSGNDGGVIEFRLNQSNSLTYQARISAISTNNAGDSSLVFSTFAGGNPVERMTIDHDGDVDISDNLTVGGVITGTLMDSEFTDLAGVKGVTISTLQVKPIEGAFTNGDKTALDASVAKLTGISYSEVGSGGTISITAGDYGGVSSVNDNGAINITGGYGTGNDSGNIVIKQNNTERIKITDDETTFGSGNNKLIVDSAYVSTSQPGMELNSSAYFLLKKPSETSHFNMIMDAGGNFWSAFKSSHHWDTYNSSTKYNYNTTGTTMYLNYYSHGNIILCGQGGNVGIGTTSPVYPLHVIGSANFNAGSNPYYKRMSGEVGSGYAGSSDLPTYTNHTTSAYFDYFIYAAGVINPSDRRIKKDIREVPDNLALEMVRKIPCKYYKYIDDVERGTQDTIGFIAQEIREIFPMASSLVKNTLPNEMRILDNFSWETITDISGDDKYKLTINDLSVNHVDISGNTKYRFYCSNEDLIEKQLEIASLEDEPKSFIFEEQWQNVFLYGKVVDDFHTIDKNKIFAMAFSATQEIDKIQQQEKAKLATAEAKLATAEAKLATAEAKLEEQTLKLTNLIEQLKANNTIN